MCQKWIEWMKRTEIKAEMANGTVNGIRKKPNVVVRNSECNVRREGSDKWLEPTQRRAQAFVCFDLIWANGRRWRRKRRGRAQSAEDANEKCKRNAENAQKVFVNWILKDRNWCPKGVFGYRKRKSQATGDSLQDSRLDEKNVWNVANERVAASPRFL